MARGTAWCFEHVGRPETLVSLAIRALRMASAPATVYWEQALATVSDEDERRLIHGVPDLSDASRNFACEVLETNRRRLLHEFS